MTFNARDEATILTGPNGATMAIHSSPGSGPVADADLAHAEANMATFVADVAAERGFSFEVERKPDNDGDGRYGFRVFTANEDHEVEMPGLPLNEVRYMGKPQNIWDFPRLIVDGSSWVWKFAIGSVRNWDDDSASTNA